MSAASIFFRMVRPCGDATNTEADLVREELAKMPGPLLVALDAAGVGVRVCRRSVVNYRPDMRNKAPRGWPAGMTWDVVPGCYLPEERNVCIATIEDEGGRWIIPPKGRGHNAWSLVLHEVMHGDDYSAHQLRSQNSHFVAARVADKASLDVYQSQAGAAGTEETYAESAARFFGRDPIFAEACPNLFAFWETTACPVPPGLTQRHVRSSGAHAFIGTANLLSNGGVQLDLRADDERGVGGHAFLRLSPGDARAEVVAARLRGRRGPAAQVPMLLRPFN